MKKTMAKIRPLADFLNAFDTPEYLRVASELITEDQ